MAAGARSVPAGSAKYTQRAYWDERFQQEEEYEWLAKWADIEPLVLPYVAERGTARVLLVGNGTSRLPHDMAAAGFLHVTATDCSNPCIERMRGSGAPPCVTWAVADMLDLGSALPPASFDLVLDKAAADAVLADGGDAWVPPPPLLDSMRRMMEGVAALLKPGGVFLQLSFSQPHFRWAYLLQRPAEVGQESSTGADVQLPSSSSGAPAEGVDPPGTDDDDEGAWEVDINPHLTPVSAGAGYVPRGSSVSGTPWASAEVHPVDCGFGYSLFALTKSL
jgi:SAM-dependent methyltransferase